MCRDEQIVEIDEQNLLTSVKPIVEKLLLRISEVCLVSVCGIPSTSIHEMFVFGLRDVISFRCLQRVLGSFLDFSIRLR